MSLKDRLNLNNPKEPSSEIFKTISTEEKDAYNNVFEKLLEENSNIIVCSPISIPTYNALNFLCSKIPNNKRLVGIGTNLLLNPNEIIKFEPDTKNLSKELIKTALSLNPYKIILQDFDGIEAVDIFKMINSNIKNIISAVNAQDAEKALRQIELNLYMNGVQIPENLMKEMITELVDNIIFVEQSGKNYFISKIYSVQGLKNNEYVISDIYKFKKSPTKTNKKIVTDEIIVPKKKNVLAEKLKRKKINKIF